MALQTACASSKEERILPLLSPTSRARHNQLNRVDSIPQYYAEMSGDELDQRIAEARAALSARPVLSRAHPPHPLSLKCSSLRPRSFQLSLLKLPPLNA